MGMDFEWDSNKEKRNILKHGIEGATVFSDTYAWTFPDPDHSDEEERFVTIGHSIQGRIIVVSHTDRGESTRIISARPAMPRERRFYEKE
jgi:uncharacterized protein